LRAIRQPSERHIRRVLLPPAQAEAPGLRASFMPMRGIGCAGDELR